MEQSKCHVTSFLEIHYLTMAIIMLFQQKAKANYPPHGINFPEGPTGRFSSGLNIVDARGICNIIEL